MLQQGAPDPRLSVNPLATLLRRFLPQPVQGSGGSTERVVNSPFMQDTIAPMMGGQLPRTMVTQENPLMRDWVYGGKRQVGGLADPITRSVVTNETPPPAYAYEGSENPQKWADLFEDRATTEVLVHEYGHIFDFNKVDKKLVGDVRALYESSESAGGDDEYRHKNSTEFFATAFEEAAMGMRGLANWAEIVEYQQENYGDIDPIVASGMRHYFSNPAKVRIMDWMAEQEPFRDLDYKAIKRRFGAETKDVEPRSGPTP